MLRRTDSIIVAVVVRAIVPFIQFYALYVYFHGHHSPGGGFQGGVILAASFVLLAISHGLDKIRQRLSEKTASLLSSLGVFIYAGIGLLCLLLGGEYLDYGSLSKLLSVVQAKARSLGILGVEIGVALAVMAVMCMIVFTIFSSSDEDEESGGNE